MVIVSFFGYLGFVFRILKAEGQLSWTGAWYLHRLWRIYLPCVVAVLINTFYRYMIHIAPPNLKEILGNIVNPTVGFWFVQAILVLYILYYITVRLLDNGTLSFKVVFITIGIIYTISYVLCVDKSYVSIESYNKPGLYITAVNKLLKLSQNFNGTMTDAQTFKTVKGLAGEGVSFESISAPGMYITYVSGKVLKLTDGSKADKCTFYLEAETKEE